MWPVMSNDSFNTLVLMQKKHGNTSTEHRKYLRWSMNNISDNLSLLQPVELLKLMHFFYYYFSLFSDGKACALLQLFKMYKIVIRI